MNENQRIQVLNQRLVSWTSDEKKNRKAGDMQLITAILHTDGALEEVCTLPLPKDHAVCPPGFYTAIIELRSTFEKKLVGTIVKLVPARSGSAPSVKV